MRHTVRSASHRAQNSPRYRCNFRITWFWIFDCNWCLCDGAKCFSVSLRQHLSSRSSHCPFYFDQAKRGDPYENELLDFMRGRPCKCFGYGCRAVQFHSAVGAIIKLISLEFSLCVRKNWICDYNYFFLDALFLQLFFLATPSKTVRAIWIQTQNVNLQNCRSKIVVGGLQILCCHKPCGVWLGWGAYLNWLSPKHGKT